MNKKTLLYVAGTVAVVGLIVWYNRSQAKKRAMATSSDKGLEETSSAVGNIPTGTCGSGNDDICIAGCESLGGTFNSSDRKCYKNGVAVTGGVFGGRGRALINKSNL